MPTRELYHRWFADDVTIVATLIETGDLTQPVPACPGWTMRDLAWHVGGVHRWAYDVLVSGTPGDRNESGPTEPTELRAWFQSGADQLAALLKSLEPTTSAWTFGPHPRNVAFWDRRQAQETAVHRWDAQASQGIIGHIDSELAGDGIGEIATVFFAREVKRGRSQPLAAGVAFMPTDLPAERYVIGDDGTDPNMSVAATLSGTALDLLLALWKRREYTDLHLDGDPAAVAALFDSVITS